MKNVLLAVAVCVSVLIAGCAGSTEPPGCKENCPECAVDPDCGDGKACQDGKCVAVALCGNATVEGTEVCDDGNTTAGDGCEPDCTPSPCGGASACGSLDGPCVKGTCNAVSGMCEARPANDGLACDDGDVCTLSTTCSDGQCRGGTLDSCDDANPCTTDSCGASGCVNQANTESCDDGDACTVGDVCADKACVPGTVPLECDDGNVCTDDACDPTSGCTNAANSDPCDDGVFCNGADSCANRRCEVHAGTPCPGGIECQSACNELDQSCTQGAGDSCTDDGNPCTADLCDASGNCTHVAVVDGTQCDDGFFCNGADTCLGGLCLMHAGDPCLGGAECANLCNEAGKRCAQPSGTPCTADTNSCTRDECNGLGACAHPAVVNGTLCNDGLFCNGADTCQGGNCSGHAGNPCASQPECQRACDETDDVCGHNPAGTACASAPAGICYDDQCDGEGVCGVKWNLYANRPIQAISSYATEVGTPLQNTCNGCHAGQFDFTSSGAQSSYDCSAPAAYHSSTGSIAAGCWLYRTSEGSPSRMPQGGGVFGARTQLMDWFCSNHQ